MENVSDFELSNFTRLQALADICELSKSPGWKKLAEFMGTYVKDAEIRMTECKSSNDKVLANLTREWSSRREFQKTLLGFVAVHVEEQKGLIEEERENEHEYSYS